MERKFQNEFPCEPCYRHALPEKKRLSSQPGPGDFPAAEIKSREAGGLDSLVSVVSVVSSVLLDL
jgi:hypothetical protein